MKYVANILLLIGILWPGMLAAQANEDGSNGWLFVTLIVLLIFLIIVIYYARLQGIQAQQKVLKKLVEERTREIESQQIALTKSFEDLQLLSKIGQDIISTLSVEEISKRVYENLQKIMPLDSFGVGIYNPSHNTLDFHGVMEKGKQLPFHEIKIEGSSKLSAISFQDQKEIWIQNYPEEFQQYHSHVPDPILGENMVSIMYLPLSILEKPIGVVTVQSAQEKAYTKYHLNFLRNLATYISIALDNAEAYERLLSSEERYRMAAGQLEASLEKEHASLKAKEKAMEKLKETQVQMLDREKMASLGQLSAGIAHEINNPINYIANSVKPLRHDLDELNQIIEKVHALDNPAKREEVIDEIVSLSKQVNANFVMDEIQSLLSGIEEGSARTQEIIAGMKNFARADVKQFEQADIHLGIDSTLKLLSNMIKNRIDIHKDYEGEAIIECLPGKINQVFMNILSNACQAIDGKGDIWISTKRKNNKLHISIKDSGPGMPEDVKRHIFEPFYTTKKVGEGTGLGLSISYGIVEEHHGTIEVDSEIGKGTEFLIVLPMRR